MTAPDIAKMIMASLGERAPGTVVVITVNESEISPGRIEVDAAFEGGAAYTPEGVKMIEAFTHGLRAAIRGAGDRFGRVIERDDRAIRGPRGQS